MLSEDKYSYNRFGSKGFRVGQAINDIILKNENLHITAEDIAEERQAQYMKDLQEAADLGKKEFDSPFYVVYLCNKEAWTDIMSRGRFVRRQSEPIPKNMVELFPHFSKDVWKIDAKKGSIDYLWTMPSLENIRNILRNKSQYDPALTKWASDPTKEMTPYAEIKQ
ncbi:MAG: hypothetical protein IMZ64_05075 [Bacteroidetes bacterium]|nr:hypothetical protein [Bacteroidota bacterium]